MSRRVGKQIQREGNSKGAGTAAAAGDGRAPGGRPSKWRPEFMEQCGQMALLGLTDEEMAKVIGVAVSTFNEWKERQPGFLEALKNGRAIADGKVGQRLFERACGYSHEAVKIFNVDGAPLIVPYTERFPPDVVACIFWLKNRQPALWRDKQEVKHTGELEVAGLPHDVLAVMRRLANERAGKQAGKPAIQQTGKSALRGGRAKG